MARQFLTGLNLNKNELLNAKIQNLSVAPSSPTAGQIYFDTDTNQLTLWDGTAWVSLAAGGNVGQAIQSAIDALDTDDIEEGSSNLYYTESRAKTDAAELLTGATLTNITITGNGSGLTITAENGVADSTTDDLDEGTTNKYFTNQRALDATASAYDLAGAASDVQDNLDDHTSASSNVHGVTGSVVGTTDIQDLSNKRIIDTLHFTDGVTIANEGEIAVKPTTHEFEVKANFGNLDLKTVATGADVNITATTGDIVLNADGDSYIGSADPGNEIATKDYVDGVQDNLDTHTEASSGVHGLGAGVNVVGDTAAQTLTNKTLTSPKINEDVALSATATELNVLDGITSSTAELNILDGATVSASELNILDGATLTTTELNYVDGVTSAIQTQLDAKLALAGGTMTGAIAMGTNKITGLGTPTDAADAATKAYVDSAAQGIDWKASVRAATTAAVTLASDLEAGDVIDGVTLVAGDRILVKNQATGSQNGIYVVETSGAPTRSTDADANAEVTANFAVFVEEGTAQADSGWVLTNNGAITVGTTALAFTQFTGLGQITAGDGLTKTANTLNVVGTADRITANGDSVDIASTYAGQSSIVTVGTITTGVWNGTDIAIADGGTGASTAAAARTNLGATTKYTEANPELTVSSGQVTWTVTHSLGIRTVVVQVYDAVSYDQVEVDVVRTGTNTVTLTWVASATVDAGKYQVVIVG